MDWSARGAVVVADVVIANNSQANMQVVCRRAQLLLSLSLFILYCLGCFSHSRCEPVEINHLLAGACSFLTRFALSIRHVQRRWILRAH